MFSWEPYWISSYGTNHVWPFKESEFSRDLVVVRLCKFFRYPIISAALFLSQLLSFRTCTPSFLSKVKPIMFVVNQSKFVHLRHSNRTLSITEQWGSEELNRLTENVELQGPTLTNIPASKNRSRLRFLGWTPQTVPVAKSMV